MNDDASVLEFDEFLLLQTPQLRQHLVRSAGAVKVQNHEVTHWRAPVSAHTAHESRASTAADIGSRTNPAATVSLLGPSSDRAEPAKSSAQSLTETRASLDALSNAAL